MVREDQQDLIYKSEMAKFNAVVDDILERSEKGQPVLVGTASVEKSEVLSRLLEKRGISHTVLNAKQHAREAQIVAQAGRLHAVTVATNMAGRGVDILLGGNPDLLAAQEVRARGLEPESEEGKALLDELRPKFEEECKAEGAKIRELGGLYVLGSERHESRRIDNQLRGRAGRQGDPGESRFFLSLEDELMRLFATGAMQWVMTRTLPEDVPIDSKMVSKAIERAQNTVEARNAEIRKDVLKYDEVMNEQRKVIYARRQQILEGEDLRSRTIDVLGSAVDSIVTANCPSGEDLEDWDLDGLLTETRQYFPTGVSKDQLEEMPDSNDIYEHLASEAIDYYEQREQAMPAPPEGAPEDTMRALEREVMLQLIDQKWREHLSEMDYLREGINLRAMGQQDPLVAWQKDGYEMFGQMMSSIDDDYVKIVMHAQVQVLEQVPIDQQPLAGAQYQAADDPVQGTSGIERALAAGPAPGEEVIFAPDPTATDNSRSPSAVFQADEAQVQRPMVLDSDFDRVGRNDPCPCGSGKKFKFCHGR
jgi:preprotein translocase subunit SecA